MRSLVSVLAGFVAVFPIAVPWFFLIFAPFLLLFVLIAGLPVGLFLFLLKPEIFGLKEVEREFMPLERMEGFLRERLGEVGGPVRACACVSAESGCSVLAARVVGRQRDYSARVVGRTLGEAVARLEWKFDEGHVISDVEECADVCAFQSCSNAKRCPKRAVAVGLRFERFEEVVRIDATAP